MLEQALNLLILFGGLSIVIGLLSLLSSAIDALNSSKTSNASYERSPSADQQEHRHPVAAAIKSYQNQRDSDERDRSKREVITIKVLTATGGFALIAAGAAIYSAWVFQGQLTEMREDRRAWIGTLPSYFISDATDGQPVNVWFSYSNFGREPGLDVKESTSFDAVDTPPNRSALLLPPMSDSFCNEHPPEHGMSVVFPNTTSGFERSTADQSINWGASLEQVTQILRARVCLSYVTLGVIRYTWSCHVFVVQGIQIQGVMNFHRWMAANCRGGGAT